MVLLDDFLAQKPLSAFSDQELIEAFKDAPRETLKKVEWSNPYNPNRQRLNKLIGSAGDEAQRALNRVLKTNPELMPVAQPAVKPQSQNESSGAESPELTAEEIEKIGAEEVQEPIHSEEDAKHLESIIKQLSKSYFDYYNDIAMRRPTTRAQAEAVAGLVRPEDASRLATSAGAQAAGQHLTNWLVYSRGDFEPYLKGATGEMIKNFLGPIGDAWRVLENVDTKLNQPQSVSPLLDPYAIDRAVKKLEHQSFEVIRAPFRTTFAILANMGIPGVKKLYSFAPVYNERAKEKLQMKIRRPGLSLKPLNPRGAAVLRYKLKRPKGLIENQPITRIVPSGFYKLFTFTEKTADRIDRWTKSPTGHLLEHAYQHRFLEDLDHAIKIHSKRQEVFALDKSERNRMALRSASRNLHRLMDYYDGREIIKYKKGKFLNQLGADTKNFLRGVTRRSLTGIAKNLRRTDRDPLTYLMALIGNVAWEAIASVTINPVIYTASRILRLIPGYNVARAYLTNNILNSPTATSARIFGGNFRSLVKGTLSLNTASSFYLGSQLGQFLLPGSPLGALTGTISGGLGAFYTTGLVNVLEGAPLVDLVSGATITMPGVGAVPAQVQWYFDQLASGPIYRRAFWGLGASQPVYIPSSELGIKTNLKYFPVSSWQRTLGGVTPSGWSAPISRFTTFLYRHPYFRLPLKGLGLAGLLAPIMEANFGWSPAQTYLTFGVAEYLWQIKRVLGFDILNSLASSRAGKWFGNAIYSPIQRRLTLMLYDPYVSVPGQGRSFGVVQKLFDTLYPKSAELQARPWLRFARNIINPGFFMGLGLVPAFLASGNVVMAIASPIAFSTAWTVYTNFLIKATNASTGRIITLAQVSPWGWIGSLIAMLTQGFVPINPLLYQAILTFGLPFVMTLFPKLLGRLAIRLAGIGLSALSGFVAGFSAGLGGLSASITAGIAGFAALIPVLSTVGLVLTAGYFIFVITSAFYTPFSDAGATATSDSFTVQTPKNIPLSVGEIKKVCPTFSINQNPLLLKDPYIYFTAQYNLTVWSVPAIDTFVVSDESENNNQAALEQYQISRLLPSFWRPSDRQSLPAGWHQLLNQRGFAGPLGHPQANNRFAILPPGGDGDFYNIQIDLGAFGKDNPDQTHQRGKTVFELSDEFSSMADITNVYLSYIAATQTQIGKDRLLENMQVQLDLSRFNQSQAGSSKNQLQNVLNLSQQGNHTVSVELTRLLNEALAKLDQNNPNYSVPPAIQSSLNQINNKLAACGEDADCQGHYFNLSRSFSGWPTIFKDLATGLQDFVSLAQAAETTNPGQPDYTQLNSLLQTAITKLETTHTDIEAQIDGLNDTMGKIRGLASGIDLNVLSPGDIQLVLQQVFGDVFSPSFYYLPQNAQFEVCITATFQPDPDLYDLNDPQDLAEAYQNAAIKIEVAGNQAYIGPLSQASGIAGDTITFTH